MRRIRLPHAYLDAGNVEHAYALTAHSLHGATLEAACIVTRPDDHTTRWTYTAASRSRHTTHHIIINDPKPVRDRRGPDVLARLLDTMSRDTNDDLATEHLPSEPAFHQPISVRQGISHKRRERGREPSLER